MGNRDGTGVLSAPGRVPGLWVVAVDAAQGAALEKDHIPQPGAVYRAQGLEGADPALHRDTWKVREMTSRCCSRESL